MKILVTNDDGYQAKGLKALVNILRKFGDVIVVAPKTAQSGMSMAVSMGFKAIAVKQLSVSEKECWYYLDGTPASCIKFGIDNVMTDCKPDLVVSGINHGSNAATATIYSGTIGAAMEGAVNLIPSIGVSLDSFSEDADFSAVEEMLPGILEKLIPLLPAKYGSFLNINFPNLAANQIKGIRFAHMGRGHWVDEYQPYTQQTLDRLTSGKKKLVPVIPEPGEELYLMAGEFTDDTLEEDADHKLLAAGYVAINVHNIDNTDYTELERMKKIFA